MSRTTQRAKHHSMVKTNNRPVLKYLHLTQADDKQNSATLTFSSPTKIFLAKTPGAPTKTRNQNCKVMFELDRQRTMKKMLFNRLYDQNKEYKAGMLRQQMYLYPKKEMALNDLIQRSSSLVSETRITKKNGNTFIQSTMRSDGTLRKERKVKPNYVPLDEIMAENLWIKKLSFIHWCAPKNEDADTRYE